MMKRQNDCEEGADWNPITIFAEGSTTNGTHIVKFKKGAFKSMRTIKPCIVKTSGRFFNQAWEVLPFGHYLTLFVCSMCFWTTKIYMMPEFTPNNKMLEKHADKGLEDWEIYAECLREAMCKFSGKPACDDPLRLKVEYEDFMCGDRPSMQVGDKIFSYDENMKGVI